MLRAIQGLAGWRPRLLVIPKGTVYDAEPFSDIETVTVDPKTCFRESSSLYQRLRDLRPDTILHPGWSWMIPDNVLALAPNVVLHPGKLPDDRGGSPIQNQILNGEEWTYLNMLRMSNELDAGPVYVRRTMSLEGNASEVFNRMAEEGAELTKDFLRGLADGLTPVPQEARRGTVYRRVTPKQAEIHLAAMDASEMHNVIRAHYETDPNSYITPAHIIFPSRKLELYTSTLTRPGREPVRDVVIRVGTRLGLGALRKLPSAVEAGDIRLSLEDGSGQRVYITKVGIE